jgi:hypothetical protein
MIQQTIVIVGAGGAGKSPLNHILKDEVIKIDPYRLRLKGPRNSNDYCYAPPQLRSELAELMAGLGEQPQIFTGQGETIEWYPRGQILFFTVRGIWQFLMLNRLSGTLAKAEIYAPVFQTLLSLTNLSTVLGQMHIIVLNPAPQKLANLHGWQILAEVTKNNCELRGDPPDSVRERAYSIEIESQSWRQLIEQHGAIEYAGWEFTEFLYKKAPWNKPLIEHQKHLLLKARKRLLAGRPELDIFFKSDMEIQQISDIMVK